MHFLDHLLQHYYPIFYKASLFLISRLQAISIKEDYTLVPPFYAAEFRVNDKITVNRDYETESCKWPMVHGLHTTSFSVEGLAIRQTEIWSTSTLDPSDSVAPFSAASHPLWDGRGEKVMDGSGE